MLRLADAHGDPSMRITGQMLLGIQTGFSGDIVTGLAYLDEAVQRSRPAAISPDGSASASTRGSPA